MELRELVPRAGSPCVAIVREREDSALEEPAAVTACMPVAGRVRAVRMAGDPFVPDGRPVAVRRSTEVRESRQTRDG